MAYEINVSLNGTHYFATHDRSLQNHLTDKVKEIYEDFKQRFPESEGFKITVTRFESTWTEMDW